MHRSRVDFLESFSGRFVQNLLGWAAPVFANDVRRKATSAVADTGAAELVVRGKLGQNLDELYQVAMSERALNIFFESIRREILLIKLNSYLHYSILVDVC